MAIEEHEFTETNLDELIERLEQDDIPTNIFTVEDTDPMVILGKLNEVIANLQAINATVTSSDTKADEALTKATQAIADATQALTTANGIDAKATLALQNAVEAVASANSAIQASTQAVTSANTALTTANTAISTANSAEETAQSAETKADNAVSTANTASATATSAKNTAEGIDAKATTALSNSQTAITTANNAVETAEDALEQVISGQGTKVYRDNTLLSSLDIKPMEDNITANSQAITNESQTRANADTTLQNNITAEATTRANADTTLQNNITAEATTRANAITALVNGKVDKVTGKGLSTEDFTTALLNKLNGIASGAEVNVQADWNTTNTNDDSFIKNKPLVPTRTSDLTNDSGFVTADTGATSVTTTGTGNAVTTASYNASTRQITLTKGSTFLTRAPVTSVSGRTGAVTTANLIADMLTGTLNNGDKITAISMGANGYITFASGLKIAWGVATNNSSAYDWTANVNFGVTFINNPTVVSTPLEASGSGCWTYVYRTLSKTGCTLRQTSKPNANGKAQYIYWFAIGV